MKRGNIVRYILLIVLACVLLFPLYWMINSSLMPNKFMFSLPPQFFPKEATLDNYSKILQNEQYLIYFRNSFISAGGTVLLTMVVAVFASYAFSRFMFKGRKVLLTTIMSVQMFPVMAILISLYTFYLKWKMLNTFPGLILANTTFCLPLCTTLLKSFFDTLPRSLDESAHIDGCGRFRTLISILLPLTLPGLVAVGIYTFLYAWDEFLFSLVIMTSDHLKTLPVGIAQSFIGEYAHDYSSMMAFSVTGSIPIVVMFVFFQKYMITGLTAGAVKG